MMARLCSNTKCMRSLVVSGMNSYYIKLFLLYLQVDFIDYGFQSDLCVRINGNIFMSPLASIQEEVQQAFSSSVKDFL